MGYKDPVLRREYARKWIANRRAEFFADKSCVLCGSTDRMELDHVDPSQKTDHRIWSWSEKRRLEEIAKCQVLCLGCHHRKTGEQFRKTLVHGSITGYTRGCRCTLCRVFHGARARAYRWIKRSLAENAAQNRRQTV